MMNSLILRAIALMLLSVSGLASADTEYVHGHGAMEIFDAEGMKNTPQWVMIWIYFMAAIFATSLFFVKNHPIARWVAGGFIAGLISGKLISSALGIPEFSGYIATIHIVFWSPALYQLISKRPFLGAKSPFAIWSGVMTFVILFSFVFDIRDSFIFLSKTLLG